MQGALDLVRGQILLLICRYDLEYFPPVVVEDGVPWVLLEATLIYDPNSLDTINAHIIGADPHNGAEFLVRAVEESVLLCQLTGGQDPERRYVSGPVGCRDLCERGEEERPDDEDMTEQDKSSSTGERDYKMIHHSGDSLTR